MTTEDVIREALQHQADEIVRRAKAMRPHCTCPACIQARRYGNVIDADSH